MNWNRLKLLQPRDAALAAVDRHHVPVLRTVLLPEVLGDVHAALLLEDAPELAPGPRVLGVPVACPRREDAGRPWAQHVGPGGHELHVAPEQEHLD